MSHFDELNALLESFEEYLGDPEHELSPMSFQQSILDDENESLPWQQIHYIQRWGYMEYLVPQQLGGKLRSLFESYCLTKSLARRDITISIALGLSFFAALPTWIAGSIKQKKEMGARLSKGEVGAFALTEEEHGSDLLANEVTAKAHSEGWVLSGKKWCINFATFGTMTTILCRTNEKGGVLGYSLFLVDKVKIKSGYTPIPKLPTHGVRGLDISGFSLEDVVVPKDALIGKERQGIEISYKALQVSRTLCACMSVGGADTALRLALSFSLKRELYGKPAYEIPAVKQRLGELFVQLLIADCTTLAVVRACSIKPEKMSLWAAIIKYLVPQVAEEIVEQSAIVLGARAYLRTTEWAIFQKIRRDVQVIGLFDGSSQVNLSLIAGQLLPQSGLRGTSCENAVLLKKLFNLEEICPDFTGNGLGLFTHGEDDIISGLAHINSEHINPLIHSVREELSALDQHVKLLQEQKRFEPRSLTAFRLAEKYCWIFAASCCLQFWYFNQHALTPALRSTDWLQLAIQLILKRLNGNQSIDTGLQETMAGHLCGYYQHNKMFSVIPTQLA